ncbi:amidase [Labrys wisconsinensis]|uniref:Indoleacetamide hydrolase n=1 Tax=Labrys wisconsinensis TaxID=425677 RepID=A0ABU0JE92_9HYPH|nr:amidase family protein [Labrys wisconsinensis]MDQ0471733.1 amidase [Labrys wisconsinensis]
MSDGLVEASATEVHRLLLAREITPGDCLDALAARIAVAEPAVNALPTLCFERAREHAARLDALAPEARGLLAGLPVAIKDLTEVEGVRTTFGSRVHEHHVPEGSDLLVETLEARGGIVYAKSNTPEFGAGGITFNDVFGETVNPRAPGRTAGGSSGGAAAALACGSAWLAQGSDLAGSLRTPASFCGVASLRPSPGLIRSGPSALPFEPLAQEGPMARDVADLALFADAMTDGGRRFRDAAARPRAPTRLAFSADLGITRCDPEVAGLVRRLADIASSAGAAVVEAAPDLAGVHEAFDTLRAVGYAVGLGASLTPAQRGLVKPEVAWNIARGQALTGEEIVAALRRQGEIHNRAAAFMAGVDVLVCPAAAVPPPPAGIRYPGHADGVPIPDYYRWLAIAYGITMTALPVITIPVGMTAAGLPVGAQLVGRPWGEAALFEMARFFQEALGWNARPVMPKVAA